MTMFASKSEKKSILLKIMNTSFFSKKLDSSKYFEANNRPDFFLILEHYLVV